MRKKVYEFRRDDAWSLTTFFPLQTNGVAVPFFLPSLVSDLVIQTDNFFSL